MAQDSKNQTKDLSDYLRWHSANTLPVHRWFEWEKIQENINAQRESLTNKRGENIISHALAFCLKSACQWWEKMMRDHDKLKQELKESKEKTKTLEEKLELTSLNNPKSLDVKRNSRVNNITWG